MKRTKGLTLSERRKVLSYIRLGRERARAEGIRLGRAGLRALVRLAVVHVRSERPAGGST